MTALAALPPQLRAKPAHEWDDDDRLRERETVKLQLAEIEIHRRNAADLKRELDRITQRIDLATDRHTSTCAPAQERIREIESFHARAIANHQPVDDALESERRNLVAAIAEANTELERELSVLKPLRQRIARDRERELRGTTEKTAIANKLAAPPLANPTLLREQFITTQSLKWAEARVRAAESEMREAQDLLNSALKRQQNHVGWSPYGKPLTHGQVSPDTVEIIQFRDRLARWEAELAAATDAVNGCRAEGKRIHDAMLNE